MITFKMMMDYLVWKVIIIMCNINKETFHTELKMIPSCHNGFCLFQHEHGCTECSVCAFCGAPIIDASDKNLWNNTPIPSLLDSCNTTVPTCNSCRDSKGSLKLKDWLIQIRKTDLERYKTIVRYHNSLQNTISLVLKRMT